MFAAFRLMKHHSYPFARSFVSLAPTRQNDLPAVRLELQKDLRAFIKKVGPELGEIYTKPDLKWGDLFRMQKVCAVLLCCRFCHSWPQKKNILTCKYSPGFGQRSLLFHQAQLHPVRVYTWRQSSPGVASSLPPPDAIDSNLVYQST